MPSLVPLEARAEPATLLTSQSLRRPSEATGRTRGTLRRAERKSRTDQRLTRETVRLGFLEGPEPHQIAAMSASRWQGARALMCLSKASSEDLLLLAGLLLCLLRFLSFLSHVALRYPSWFNASRHRHA